MKTIQWIFILMLTFISVQQSIAQSMDSLRLTATYENMSLSTILEDIESKYTLSFYYESDWLPTEPVSIAFQNTPLFEALTRLFEGKGIAYMDYSTYAIIAAKETDLSKEYTKDFYITQYKEATKIVDPNKGIFKITAIGDSANISRTGQAVVTGRIFDEKTQDPIIGATFYIKELDLATVSDINGKYTISIPVGQHNITIQSIGYQSMELPVLVFSDETYDVPLVNQPVRLGEIVVQGESATQNVQSTKIGLEQLSIKEIKELPAFMGEVDIIKSLLSLPGVTTVGEGASGFNVRGGNVDQNLITQDGALVLNSSHILGFFSVFNPDLVRNVNLYKGHIPAKFGGRLSSVLEVNLKDGHFQTYKGSAGVGIASSSITYEGPIKTDKTSFIIGARTAYPSYLLRATQVPNLQGSSTAYYDITGKVTHRLGEGSTASLTLYGSYDDFEFNTNQGLVENFGYNWSTQLATLSWQKLISNGFASDLNITFGNYSSSFLDLSGNDAAELKSGLSYTKLKQNFYYAPAIEHGIDAGIEWVYYSSKNEDLQLLENVPSSITPVSLTNPDSYRDKGSELALYIDDDYIISPNISLSLGIRFSMFQNIGPDQVFEYQEDLPLSEVNIIDSTQYASGEAIQTYTGWEPRASLKISLTESSSIKLSYNRMYQYIHLLSNSTSATPVDMWQVSNRYIQPQISNNYTLGVFKNFGINEWETSLELYYKDIESMNEYKDLAQLILNPTIETEILNGIGQAYGAEVSIKKNVGRWTGRLAYTYARTLFQVKGEHFSETINDGEWVPANFDKPHNVNVLLKYKINRRQHFSFNFVYNTGRPITIPISNYTVNNVVIPQYSVRNQFRIPDYHRLDFSYTLENRAITKKRFQDSWTISLFNLYGRRNPYSIFFTRQNVRLGPSAFKLSVLGSVFPTLTYHLKF